MLEKDPLIGGLETLEEAIASFLHICFVGNMQYPKVSALTMYNSKESVVKSPLAN